MGDDGGRGARKKWMGFRAILEIEMMGLANQLGVEISQRAYLCTNITIFLYSKLFFLTAVQLHTIEMSPG